MKKDRRTIALQAAMRGARREMEASVQRLDEEASGRPTRVLLLSDPFPPFDRGGAGRIAYYHAHALRDRGYDVAVVTTYEAKSRGRPSIGTEEGVRVFRVFSRHPFVASQSATAFDNAAEMGLQLWNPLMQRCLEAVAAEFRPDLVHAHHIPRISFGAFARMAPGVPHVLTFHTYHYECPKGGLYRKGRQAICEEKPSPCRAYLRLVSRQLAGVDRIVAISHFIQGRLLQAGHDRSKVVYIPNGVPGLQEREPTPPSRTKELLFVGRIVHNKGLRELIRAVREIADPELRLSVVGDGELLATLRRDTRNDPRIRYTGWLGSNEVAERYRSCRVVVVPSLWHEVMNTVVCEAQAWSRPVIATRVGGNGDLIVDGESGILCPPGDVPAMRRAIVRLINDDELSAAIGRAGFEQVKQYGMRRHIDAIEELYRGLGYSARAPVPRTT